MSLLDYDVHAAGYDAYEWFVHNAPEIKTAMRQWTRERGKPYNDHVEAHVYWMVFRESERWRTIRNMLEEREVGPGQPPPVPNRPEPDPPPPWPEPDPPPAPGPDGGLRLIRVASAAEGPWHPRMMSYWSNAFIHNNTDAYVFAGHQDGRPRFFAVALRTGAVRPLGALVQYDGTTEGWYWTAAGYIHLLEGAQLRRVNPLNPADDRVVMDISSSHPGCRLWQAHSSDDGRSHSATVEQIVNSGAYPRLGTVVQHHDQQRFFPVDRAPLDESAVSGTHLVIKEANDNRIIDLRTWDEWWIADSAGALGHSDMGDGFMVGEDDTSNRWQMTYWDLRQRSKRVLLRDDDDNWGQGMCYVSAKAGRFLHSGPTHLGLVGFDGSYTTLLAHGGGTEYDDRVKAALTPCGRAACYMSGGDIYLLVL